jgi:hypothetical protein
MKKKNPVIACFLVLLSVFAGNEVYGQHVIAEAGIQFTLNDTFWMQVTSNKDKTPTSTIYRFKRQALQTPEGKQVVPVISVIVEPVADSIDIMLYSSLKRVKTPLDIEEVINPGKDPLTFPNAIAFRGGFTDPAGTRHKTTLIYLIHKNKGMQMVMDIDQQLWDVFQEEFYGVIRSIEVVE